MTTNSCSGRNILKELIEEIKYIYQFDKRPWVIGYSGGKDSVIVFELVYKILLSLPDRQRSKNVYVVFSDTLVENPLIKVYLSRINELIGKAAKQEVVVILGVRKAENIIRKRHIEGKGVVNRFLNRHETIQDIYVYSPIVELTTGCVWDILLMIDGEKTPWGSDNNELTMLCLGTDGGKYPFARTNAGNQVQSYGNSGFGCWGCMVVKEDKPLNDFIKMGYRELIPLAVFRTWIMSIRDRDEFREKSVGKDLYMEQG